MSDLEKPNDASRQPPPGVGSPQPYQQPYAQQQPYMQQQQPQPYMHQQPYQQPYMQQQQPQYMQQQQQPQYMQQQQPQYMQQQPQYMQQQQPQYMQQQQPQYVQQQQVTYANPVQPLQLVGTTILTTTVPFFLPPLLPPQPPNLWTSDFCDCCAECGNCFETAICPYCQLGYLDRKLSSGYSGLDWGTCLMYWCIDTWFTCGLALAWGSCQTRDRVRLRFNIEPQDTCKNCAQGFFCPHISLCQSYRELSHRGYWPEGMCVNVPPPVTHPMGNPMPVQVVNAVTMP